MKLSMMIAASILAAAALVAGGCGPRGGPDEERAVERVPVRVVEIKMGPVTATVAATGTIKARDDVPISAEASGCVLEVVAQVGDRVSEGDVLVQLDDELAEFAFRQAEAQSLLAEAELDDAEAGFARAQSLWESGDIADAEREATERRAKSARASFAAASAGQGRAERQLRNTGIKSPIDGTVAFMYVEEGQLIAVGTSVAHVVNDDVVEIELGLSEDQVPDIRPRQAAAVRVRALPGEAFDGKVEYVGRRADDMTKTYPVRVVLKNPAHQLRAGMSAEVTIDAKEFSDVVVIERDWVVERYGEPAVYVASGSLAVLKRLTLGKVIGNRVVVTSGLEEGDLMVTFGHDRLTDGAALEIKSTPGDSADQHASGSDDR